MNIAELRPSDEAPDTWKKQQQRNSPSRPESSIIAAAFRKQLLANDPHIIFIQECPGAVAAVHRPRGRARRPRRAGGGTGRLTVRLSRHRGRGSTW